MAQKQKMTTERALGWAGISSALISALYLSWQ